MSSASKSPREQATDILSHMAGQYRISTEVAWEIIDHLQWLLRGQTQPGVLGETADGATLRRESP